MIKERSTESLVLSPIQRVRVEDLQNLLKLSKRL